MIVYFDTSAVVPLLIEESGSATAVALWDSADRVVSVRLLYAEARAAVAQAERTGRVTPFDGNALVDGIDTLYTQLDLMEIDDWLVRRAGDLAQEFGLRGYDAVHLAGAERLDDAEVVLAAGGTALLEAAVELGLNVSRTS